MSDEWKPADLTPPPPEEPPQDFPEKLACHRCRRHFYVLACHSRANTLVTDIQLSCPRCRRKLRLMRFKDWYDRYIHQKLAAPQVSS